MKTRRVFLMLEVDATETAAELRRALPKGAMLYASPDGGVTVETIGTIVQAQANVAKPAAARAKRGGRS